MLIVPARRHLRLPPIAVTVTMVLGIAALAWSRAPIDPQTVLSSLAGAGALALAAWQLLRRLQAPDPDRAAALVLLLPSVALGHAQDALSAAILLLALVAALDKRHGAMLAWCGLAIGLNLQAALTAPVFLAVLINRRVALRLWPVAPAAVAAALFGTSIIGISSDPSLPLHQAIVGELLSRGAPNLWAIMQMLPSAYPLLGLALALAIGAAAAFIAHVSARPIGARALLSAALLCSLLTAGLLPLLNDRAFQLAAILAWILALVQRDRAGWRIAALVQAGSLLAMLGHASDTPALAALGGGATIWATLLLARPLVNPAANDNAPLRVRSPLAT